MMASSEETAVKNRLLFDGAGANDDRKFSILTKEILKWVKSPWPCDQESDEQKEKVLEEDCKTHAKIKSMLTQYEFLDSKNGMVQAMNKKEALNYETLFEKIRQDIAKAEVSINGAMAELEDAKRLRCQRQEYDALAKAIKAFPDRVANQQRLQVIQNEMESLKQAEDELEGRLQLRRKQFYVLVSSIHKLQSILDEDEEHEVDQQHHLRDGADSADDDLESLEENIMDTT